MAEPSILGKRKRYKKESKCVHWETIDSNNKECEIKKIRTLRKIISHINLFTGSFGGEPYSVEYFEVDINGHTAYYITFHYHNGDSQNCYNSRLNRYMLSYLFKDAYSALGNQTMEFGLIGPPSTKNRFLNRSYTATKYISLSDLIDNQSLRESIGKMLRDVNAIRIIQMMYLRYRIKKIQLIKNDIIPEIALVEKKYKKNSFTRQLYSAKSLKGLYDLLKEIQIQQEDEQTEKKLYQEYLETLKMASNDKNATV